MKYSFNRLIRNSITKSIIKKVIPKQTYSSVVDYLNKGPELKLYYKNDIVSIDNYNKEIHGLMPVYYCDDTPNFGDFIGPYLISKITNKPVLNVRLFQHSGIMAVGSIAHMVDRKNMVMWGSGLMYPLTDEKIRDFKRYNPEILSVRGMETAKLLLEAGIDVPNHSFYGDPALIMPLFYKPSVSSPKKIGICPHYVHKPYFLKNIFIKNSLKIIDVQQDVETVVDSISSSSVCISTSLHGLIIAQAYGIPWVWLEISDNPLFGKDFKFKDFFSTLNKSQVSHVRVSLEEVKSLDYDMIAEKATLPDKLYNEDLILESLKIYLGRNVES